MRRFAFVLALVVTLPATALAADLDELLERGHDASYSADQIITCSTPEGVTDAVVRISQRGGDLHLSAPVSSDVEVTSGYGGWTLSNRGAVVTSAEVDSGDAFTEPRYEVDDGTPAAYLGRRATLYRMRDGGLLRAELLFDNEIGALLRAVTYTADGDVYCERRFIAFNPTPPVFVLSERTVTDRLVQTDVDSDLPDELSGFSRLDLYSDQDGFVFAYYSDGFFSFAVFETPSVVDIGESSELRLNGDSYRVAYTPGQVTYVWETRTGGMALIGDLPPDMHSGVLEGLPTPQQAAWWDRLWRRLFG